MKINGARFDHIVGNGLCAVPNPGYHPCRGNGIMFVSIVPFNRGFRPAARMERHTGRSLQTPFGLYGFIQPGSASWVGAAREAESLPY